MVPRARALSLLAVAAAWLGAAAPAGASLSGTPTLLQSGLQTPWEIAPAPDGRMFITERDAARVRVRLPSGVLRDEPALQGVPPYDFFGLALHPDFAVNHFVYLFQRYPDGAGTKTRVVRLRDDGTNLVDQRTVFDGIPSGDFHDGGRIAFGPDGKLYVTTGDQHKPELPQDRESLNGKILRLNAPGDDTDGTAPADNPFPGGVNARYVWSFGHRHPQGLAWDAQGRLWSSEHGPSGEAHAPAGATTGHDELNLIVKGANYGWPLVAGDQTHPSIPDARRPVIHSGAIAWAPGDLAFGTDGVLYAPALKGAHLHAFDPVGETVSAHCELYPNQYGRLRVAVPHAGALLFASDGDAELYRVPFGGAGSGCPVPPPADGETPAETTTTAPLSPSPAVGVIRPATAVALDRLVARARASLRRAGLRGLLRRRSVAARVGGLPNGRVVLRAELRRPGRRALVVAKGSANPRSRAPVTVRARLTRSGRAALRRTRRARLVLRVTHTPPRSTRSTRATARITLTR